MHRLLLLIILSGFTALTGCKDYAAESIMWINDLETGAAIETIKSVQPSFVEINWGKPDTVNYKLYYLVTINGSKNILDKTHHLVFRNNRFLGCSHHHKQ